MAKIILNVDLNSAGAEQELQKFKKSIQSIGDPKAVKNIDNLRKGYANLLNTIQGAEKNNYAKGTFSKITDEARKYLAELKSLDIGTKAGADRARELAAALQRLQADFAETRNGATNFHGSLRDLVGGFMKFQLAAMLVMKPLQLTKQALEDINETLEETEKRVIALRRVAGDAANAQELYALAKKYGQTFENVSDVVESFAKSGYDWADSLKAAEAAIVAMNVAELDAEQSSEGLIAIMKQYGFEIENLTYIVDVLNKTADSAAVNTEELLIALQKTGSTAKNANIPFEETVGLITALSEGTAASGQNIGNALRSLIVFTSDSKALDKFAGLSENMAKIVKNFRSGQASILDIWQGLGAELQKKGSQKGTLEDLFGGAEMTADIEAQLTQITDSFAEIYGTAGNYRQNYFIALLNNIDEVTRATENMSNVSGYSQQENLVYMDTYEAKVNSLKATWQEMANDEQGFLSFKKSLVDMANSFLGVEKSLGGVRTMAVAVATVMATMFGEKIMSGFKDLGASLTALRSGFKKTENAAASLNAKLGVIGIVATVITAAFGAIDAGMSKKRDDAKKSVEEDAELVKSAHEVSDAYSDTAKKIGEYAEKVEELRRITDDTSSSTEDVATAQAELALIQSELTKNTDTYAGKIDLVNGKLQEQLKYVKELGTEELKANAQKFLDENAAAIATAESAVNSSSSEKTDLIISTNAFRHGNNKDIINSIISGSGVSDNVSGRFSMGAPIVGLDPWKDAYDAVAKDGFNAAIDELIKAPLEGDTYFGSSDAKLMLSGTTEEKIGALKKMIAYVNSNYKDLGITSDESAGIIAALNAELKALDTDEYRSSVDLAEKAQIYKDYLSDIITEEEFLEKIYGITKETANETKNWGNSLNDLAEDTLNEVVSKLEEARDLTKESYEYEEKKKAVLEAEAALLEAQTKRDTRVYNRETGTWEWQSNAKAVQEAQENLDAARLAIEQEAYNEIITLLKSGDATNEALLQVMARWAAAYGSGDFSGIASTIRSIIKQATGIDISTPTASNKNSEFVDEVWDGYTGEIAPSKTPADLARIWYRYYLQGGDKAANDFLSSLSPEMQEKVLTALSSPNLNLYDSGGVLRGMGGIKATREDEVVLSPEITSRLLNPVSNAQFDTFVKDIGILFGASKSADAMGGIVRHGGTSLDSHDTSYNVNGVPIPATAAEQYTIKELFELFPII